MRVCDDLNTVAGRTETAGEIRGQRDSAGGPLKPSFGLSGAVRQLDRASLPLARAFLPSTRTQPPLGLRSRLRIDESCSSPNLPDVHITRA